MIVRAPGKVFLVGEYGVLDGAPAVVAAVDSGVEVEVTGAPPAGSGAAGVPSSPLRGSDPAAPAPPPPGAGREEGLPPGVTVSTPADDRFARAALLAAEAPPGHYAFRPWNPLDLPGKPGLGGSAAAVVAAVAAASLARGESLDGVVPLALSVHRRVQGGGSGVDVRAAFHGGVACYAGSSVDPVPAPRLVVVWTGRSAATGPRVAAYEAWRGPERAAFVRRSAAIVGAWPNDPVQAVREDYRLLVDMTLETHIDYLTPAHERIVALAEAHHGAAKPSGAGGGDVAVAVFPPEAEDEARAFAEACEALGLPPLPLHVAPGVGAVELA